MSRSQLIAKVERRPSPACVAAGGPLTVDCPAPSPFQARCDVTRAQGTHGREVRIYAGLNFPRWPLADVGNVWFTVVCQDRQSQPSVSTSRVIKSEEKGSDVDQGVHLGRDAFQNAFNVAVVLTTDSDLVKPIRIAIHEAGKRVGLLVPVKYPTQSLMAVASFYLRIRPSHLARAQFADPLV